MREVSEISVF